MDCHLKKMPRFTEAFCSNFNLSSGSHRSAGCQPATPLEKRCNDLAFQ